MGHNMVSALKALNLNFVVYDKDPAKRELARRELGASHVIDDLSEAKHRSLFVIGCAKGKVLGIEELKHFAQRKMMQPQEPRPIILCALGSGRSFDVDGIAAVATSQNNFKQHIGDHDECEITEYLLELPRGPEWPGGKLRVIALNDGYVDNLGRMHPSALPYAINTPLTVWEGLRQGKVLMDQGQTGIHDADSFAVQLTPEEHPRRVFTFFPWTGGQDVPLKTEVDDRPFQWDKTALEYWADAAVFYRSTIGCRPGFARWKAARWQV
jgi:hypothetical protein